MEEKEIWKTIPLPELNGYYEASTLGRIRSVDRVVESDRNGEVFKRLRKGKILTGKLSNSGYMRVGLCVNSRQKKYLVHRLVALTFIDNTENKTEVNHINGVKTDNRAGNLEWVTAKENVKHSIEVLQHGIRRNGKRKLTKEQVRQIMLDNRSLRSIAKDYGVSKIVIECIRNGKTYKDWTENIGK